MPRNRDRYIQVENKNALLELLLDDVEFTRIILASNAHRDPKTKKIIEEAHKRGIPVERVPRKKLERVSRTSTHESIIGFKPAPKQPELEELIEAADKEKSPLFFLVLNNVMYSQNVGALLRTAYGSGVTAVIMPKKRDLYLTDEVTRISMGASERIPVIQTNVFDALKKLKDYGVRIVGIHMDGKPHYEVDLRGDVALVLGSEDTGVSPRILERCDETASIPMQEGLGSLNVSASGAVVMFEKKRQDKAKR